MGLHKLESTDAFIVRDLDDDAAAAGVVRMARKILQGGAKEMARAKTYQYASFGMKVAGASAGINAEGDARSAALEAFAGEIAAQVESGELLLDPGKGVQGDTLATLLDVDPRNDARRRVVGGDTQHARLTALGLTCSVAQVLSELSGRTVAIEGFNSTGVAVARSFAEYGAKTTQLSTAKGTVARDEGFDVDELSSLFAEHGPDMVDHLGESAPANAVFAADVDVLAVGSKMGVVNHWGAEKVKAKVLAPWGTLPFTTKAMLVMRANGTVVLPDYVTTAGPLFADFPPNGADQPDIEASVCSSLAALTDELMKGADGPTMEAAYRAESFLSTWVEKMPFGRPFAP